MARLRDHWLEAVSACVTAALVGVVYTVLQQYAAGPPLTLHVSALQHATTGAGAISVVPR